MLGAAQVIQYIEKQEILLVRLCNVDERQHDHRQRSSAALL